MDNLKIERVNEVEGLSKDVADYILDNATVDAKKTLINDNTTVDRVVEMTEIRTGKMCSAWAHLKALAYTCRDNITPILISIKALIIYLVKVGLKYTKYALSKVTALASIVIDKLNSYATSSYEDEDSVYTDTYGREQSTR